MKRLFVLLIMLSFAHTSIASCISYNEKSTPTDNFNLDNESGTAIDTTTNLMWSRCLLGVSWTGSTCDTVDPLPSYNWWKAHQAADDYTFGGYSDWRIPNIKELISIVEYSCTLPALNQTIFPNLTESIGAWSSTPQDIFNSTYSFVLFTNVGYAQVSDKTKMYPLFLVRDL